MSPSQAAEVHHLFQRFSDRIMVIDTESDLPDDVPHDMELIIVLKEPARLWRGPLSIAHRIDSWEKALSFHNSLCMRSIGQREQLMLVPFCPSSLG